MQDLNNKQANNKDKGETNVSPVSFHNLYKHMNISIKTLDFIIVFLVLVLIIALTISIKNRGFLIEFDSQGGTYIETQKHYYGEKINYIIPTRDNYKFAGWSLDKDCNNKWDQNRDIIESIKLYACWIDD